MGVVVATLGLTVSSHPVPMRFVRPFARVAALLAISSCASMGKLGGGTAGEAHPSLVVVLTVDQLGSDFLERYGASMTGGIRRLLDEGAVWPFGVHDHAITETAPGHASILSGRFPVHTGISSNSQGVNTSAAPLLGASEVGASPYRFRGTALYDWMLAADPSARALSVSRKDRGAILPIGRAKTDVYWYASNGTFTTSTYYRDALPGWVSEFNARRVPHSFAGRRWDLLRSAAQYPAADTVPREADGVDIVFPHLMPSEENAAAQALTGYPWMDSLTLSFALEGARALGLGGSIRRTDLLAVSLSTTDAVGHRYGPDSRELHDQLLRLDRDLDWFLDSLETLRDGRPLLLVLTADHGVAPYPDLRSEFYANHNAQRVDLSRAMAFVKRRMQADGVDSAAVDYDDGFRVLDPAAFRRARRDPDTYAALWVREMRRFNGVLRADLVRDLVRADTTQDVIARRWLHMFGPDDDVRAVVTFTPFSYPASVTYATHGSPHEYDARVPIVFWGAGVPAGLRTGEARVVDIAPTLADWLGVRPTERLDGVRLPLVP
jgi:predicted AlkP superfamily pyrophosphatase or phosphodiesterase